MLADPATKTTIGVGLDDRNRRPANPEAWKRAIGTKPVSARLALLPEGESRWGRVGVSAIAQIVIVGFIFLMPLLYPESMRTALNYSIIELANPPLEIPVAPPPPPPPKVREKVTPPPTPPPVVEEPVKLNPKQQHVFITPKAVVQPKVQTVDAKAPDLAPVLEAAKIETPTNQPKRPKEDVKIGSLGSAAPATVNAPVNKVQTGGFGDPTGLKGKGDPNKGNIVNAFGSPNLPTGPGQGNGTGGANGIKGTVASTGFGNGTANPPQGGGKRGSVQSSGFGDQTVAEAPKKKVAATEGATTSVDILEKPKPEYTAEGRSLKLEGDVVLDLVFLANGTVEVKGVVSGLGHGLDEAATRAAQQIKFKPAHRDGQAVDFPARVRIQFRLAY
jgi:TonB family protein